MNFYAESAFDVFLRYEVAFFHDFVLRPADEQTAFHEAHPSGSYAYSDFKEHVRQALRAKFKDAVKPGTKAFTIEADGNRRKADVIVAFEYRRYYKFKAFYDESHVNGMCFILKHCT